MLTIQRQSPEEKLILGLSLGSSQRDHEVLVTLGGAKLRVYRVGTDGDFARMLELYRSYDGRVDAFGFGGAEFDVACGGRRYAFRQGRAVRAAARRTPIADGNGVKGLLERRAVEAVAKLGVELAGMPTLCVSAVDRPGLAQALLDHGCRTTFGDVVFSLGLPIPLRSLAAVQRVGRVLLPLVTQLPYALLYPTGKKQEQTEAGSLARLFKDERLYAGDFNWLKRALPARLDGRIVLTNTTTAKDVELLRSRGLELLVTGTPRLGGRSFGTNVVEAMLLALLGRPQAEVTEAHFAELIEALPLEPEVLRLQEDSATA